MVEQRDGAASAARPRRGSRWSSFGVANVRLYFAGQVLSTVGVWMQQVAEEWTLWAYRRHGVHERALPS